jgi:hypothetical protein
MIKNFKSKLSQFNKLSRQIEELEVSTNFIRESLGRVECRQVEQLVVPEKITDVEFKVFSQWGEDGIIQYLIREICPKSNIFVEFGVENYQESNTRFLLVNNNWAGLIIDGNAEHIACIRNQPIYWQRNLKAAHEFITAENVNNIFKVNGISGEIGLLSVDVDGNDYWIWKVIDCVSPAIVICEYNFRFGPDRAVTVPYDPGFVRSEAHHSMIYYGASLKALTILAKQKGYVLVGCNSAGNNAFFVRKDLNSDTIREVSVEAGFVQGKYRETRHPDGQLAYLSHDKEVEILATLPLVEIE